ncbi:uncharacterized protein LOC114358707 [Ostrinia furnacalis]|uniref:uncharacterized protein LOC114358707 n=1 Tax=Ostrinia furnacalis TaxID=93504 RepID=UPI00103F9829|nr:uncharacterized protein LOC114358707 [Ostrinia furnacalis]
MCYWCAAAKAKAKAVAVTVVAVAIGAEEAEKVLRIRKYFLRNASSEREQYEMLPEVVDPLQPTPQVDPLQPSTSWQPTPPLIVVPADVEFVNNEDSDDERQIGDSDGSVGTAEADTILSTLKRYRRVQSIQQHFWKRFSNDYVSLLQLKTKWRHGDTLKPESLVLIRDKTAPPLIWLLGRIVKTYPEVDGVSRVAEIRTKKGTIRRGFNNICVLPLDDHP